MNRRTTLCLALFVSVSLVSLKPARADVSSWLLVGGGPSWISEQKSGYNVVPTLQFDAGLGTNPSRAIVLGILARSATHFGDGTDLGLAARLTTGGFSRGVFGLAIDGGLYRRWWGVGSWGPMASLHLGAPYGLQLTANVEIGTHDNKTFSALIGVDLLRLTVHRSPDDEWWPNPRPSYSPTISARSTSAP